jgi:hypothetical protein
MFFDREMTFDRGMEPDVDFTAPFVETPSVEVETGLEKERFKEFLGDVESILENNPPEKWWKVTERYLGILYALRETMAPKIKHFLESNLDDVFAIFEKYKIIPNELDSERQSQFILEQAQSAMREIADLFFTPEEVEDLKVAEISVDQLVEKHENLQTVEIDGRRVIQVQKSTGKWFDFPMSTDPNIFHKGGTPRVLLKIMAGASQETIDRELPPNDFDLLVFGGVDEALDIGQEAEAIGADIDGIEHAHSEDMNRVMAERDIDLNQCLVSGDRFVYTESALHSAETGFITVASTDKGIYGTEKFHYQGEELIKNRGLYRLFKFVAEGKAESFALKPLNKQVDFSIYWLVLAGKFSKKPNAGELLDKLYHIGTETGQVQEGEESIVDVLNRVHEKFPFFDMDDRNGLDEEGLAKWLNKKLGKVVDRSFRQTEGIKSDMCFERADHDTKPENISLEGYQKNAKVVDDFSTWWKDFSSNSRERTNDFNQK